MERKRITGFALLFFLLAGIHMAQAQENLQQLKLPEGLHWQQVKNAEQVLVVTTSSSLPNGKLQQHAGGIYVFSVDPKKTNPDSLLRSPAVLFIQPLRQAREEMVINGSDLSLNTILFAHTKYPFLAGKNLTASIKENLPDTTDIDFNYRYLKTGLESNTLSGHATNMATLIAGAGNSYYTGKGVAYKAGLGSVSFQTLLPEHDSVYQKFRFSIQNHSYGTGIENFYGADSWAYDVSVKNNDSLLHVFSAGNSGTQTSTTGMYAGINGYANLTGSFKQSKNSLSIAATDSFYQVELLSSKGPAYDGRIKPELVAFGQDGSSGAAALVSGSALLIQDAFKQQTGRLPSSSLVRAALINAADDILQPGPDFISGFGSLNTERAIRQIVDHQYFTGNITNAAIQQFTITVPVNMQELKITLAWNDIPAAINASKALVNDLDLEVVEVGSGLIYYPFVLNHYPQVDSLNAMAVPKKDTLNNIEQVAIQLPAAGSYIIRIKAAAVQGTQAFGVVYHAEAAHQFQFTYPSKGDNLYPGMTNTIRWNSTLDPSAAATLQISYDGTSWTTLNPAVNLSAKYFKTVIKDTTAVARLRMIDGSTTVFSDSFTIAPRLQVTVGYNCPDSFQLYWNKLKGVTAYHLFALADTFMKPVFQTSDSFFTAAASSVRHYAVAPVTGNRTALRSYTYNYTTQGVGCFVNSFLADVFNDTLVQLKAVLGSIHGVKEMSFQRLYPLTTISTFQVNKDTFATNDVLLKNGMYYYRVNLLFYNGKQVITDTIAVRIFQNKYFFVYPNPYRNGGRLLIQSKEYTNTVFELFNISGQKMYSRLLTAPTEEVALPFLPVGVYFYRIIQTDRRVVTGKLLVH